METALAAVVAIGPLVLIMLLLLRSIRPSPTKRYEAPPVVPYDGPADHRRRGTSGDRSPTRPRVPTMSGGAALEIPQADVEDDDEVVVTRIAHGGSSADRLAG